MKHRNYLTDKIETRRTIYTLFFLSRGMHSTEAEYHVDMALSIARIMAHASAIQLEYELSGLTYGNTLGV